MKSKTILIASPYFPYPIFGGGHQALFNEIDILRSKYNIILVCPFTNLQSLIQLTQLWGNVKIEILSTEEKKEKKSILKFVKGILGSANSSKDYSFYLKKPFFEYQLNSLLSLDDKWVKSINQLIEKYKPDIVQAEFTPLLNNSIFLPKNILKVFVHHEINFIRLQRNLKISSYDLSYQRSIVRLLRNIELQLLDQYDCIITLSEIDKKHLTNAGLNKPIYASPFPMTFHNNQSTEYTFNNRLVFVGGESHYPNLDGLQWFISEIWPIIKKTHRKLELHIIGKWINETKKRLSSEDVFFHGFVVNLREYLENSITIVPLRIGSGIRVKILESLNMGAPVISTSIGTEGLENSKILVANTALDFGNALQKLLHESTGNFKLSQARNNDFEKIFSNETFLNLREIIYEPLISQ